MLCEQPAPGIAIHMECAHARLASIAGLSVKDFHALPATCHAAIWQWLESKPEDFRQARVQEFPQYVRQSRPPGGKRPMFLLAATMCAQTLQFEAARQAHRQVCRCYYLRVPGERCR